MPLDPGLQKALNEARLAVEGQTALTPAELKNSDSLISELFQVFSKHSSAQRKQKSRLLTGTTERATFTSAQAQRASRSSITDLDTLATDLNALLKKSGPTLREALKIKLQAAEQAALALKDDAFQGDQERKHQAEIDLWQKLLILLAMLSPLQIVEAPKAARASAELDWQRFEEEAEEAKGDRQEAQETKSLAPGAVEDESGGKQEEKPRLFYIAEGYAFQIDCPRWAFDYFCRQERVWLSERDKQQADKLLGVSDGFAFASWAEREVYADKAAFGFKFSDQADYEEYLSLTTGGLKFADQAAWETHKAGRTAQPIFSFRTITEQEIYQTILQRGFSFANQVEYDNYLVLIAQGYKFKNQGEWEAYKAAIAAYETFADQGYWEAYKNRFKQQRQAPFVAVTDSLLYGPERPMVMPAFQEEKSIPVVQSLAALASPVTSVSPIHAPASPSALAPGLELASVAPALQSPSRPATQSSAVWRWLAWFLVLSCLAACLAAITCGAAALATQAAVWILPLNLAFPVILISAGVFLLVMLGMLAYFNSQGSAPGPAPLQTIPLPQQMSGRSEQEAKDALLAATIQRQELAGRQYQLSSSNQLNTADYKAGARDSEQLTEEQQIAIAVQRSLEKKSR